MDGVAGRAELAEQRLSQTAAAFSWQWGPLWAGTAALRAEVVNLEARGGKATLTVCGDKKRLCAEIDTRAPEYGERGQFRILKGY